MLVVVVLYALASAFLVAVGLHLGVLAGVRATRPARPVPTEQPPVWPPVLVQVPVYNEPPALVARVLDAVGQTAYAGPVRVQLLDDSTDGSAADNAGTCAARGVEHVRRGSREGFKAGALAAGLGRSDAPFAAVLDVDFVPPPDFLTRTVGALVADGGLAFAQARWVHPEAEATALGRVQAAVLDVHFAVEQGGRDRAGLPIAFNGTAGTWRTAAIRDVGGWHGDTLAEDLDLALRAQLGGWRARLLHDLTVPATLPPTLAAWRVQQTRWTKGGVEVGRKLLGRVWRSGLPLVTRVAVTMQTLVALALPALLTIVLLHPWVAVGQAVGAAPAVVMQALSAGYLALGGVLFAHAVAQRAIYPATWRRRLARVPLVLAAPLALVGPASRGVAEALAGRRSPFVRTPKDGRGGPARVPLADLALALYSVGGAVAVGAAGAWAALPFQAILAVGSVALVVSLRAGRAPRPLTAARPVEAARAQAA